MYETELSPTDIAGAGLTQTENVKPLQLLSSQSTAGVVAVLFLLVGSSVD